MQIKDKTIPGHVACHAPGERVETLLVAHTINPGVASKTRGMPRVYFLKHVPNEGTQNIHASRDATTQSLQNAPETEDRG